MTITPPESSAILADIPEHLKLKDSIKWNASGKVSFYRIKEIVSDLDFLNRVKVFSTVKTSFPVQNIGERKMVFKNFRFKFTKVELGIQQKYFLSI